MRRSVIGLVFAFAGFFVVVYPAGAQTAAKADAKPAGTQTATAGEWKTLTHDELVALFGGKAHQMQSVTERGQHFTLEFKPDGTLAGEYESSRSSRHTAISDNGKWEIKENQFCVRWNRWQQGAEKCWGAIVKSDSGEYRFTSASGHLITFSQ